MFRIIICLFIVSNFYLGFLLIDFFDHIKINIKFSNISFYYFI